MMRRKLLLATLTNTIGVNYISFEGALDGFAALVQNEHGDNDFGKEYMLHIVIVKLRIMETKL
jgi:hypothetical protein